MQQHPTILIADDHPDTRNILTVALTSAGYRTVAAEDGLEAIDIIEHTKPDLLILDINMPRGNGLEVLAHVQRDPSLRGLPVFFFTSMSRLFHPDMHVHGVTRCFVKGQATPSEIVDSVRVLFPDVMPVGVQELGAN